MFDRSELKHALSISLTETIGETKDSAVISPAEVMIANNQRIASIDVSAPNSPIKSNKKRKKVNGRTRAATVHSKSAQNSPKKKKHGRRGNRTKRASLKRRRSSSIGSKSKTKPITKSKTKRNTSPK